MKKQYTSTSKKSKPYEVRYITANEFQFRSVNVGEDDKTPTQAKAKKPKKEKKSGKRGKNGTPPPPRQ